ncbi:MAG: outer membrane protein assembly factor BamD [Candidatus Omnitrophota bacterium]
MKRSIPYIAVFVLLSIFVLPGASHAYWIWTPETKKFTNPKNAVKDTPKEQFEYAMSFYDVKDYQRAAPEFEKLAKQYEFSDYASKAQYYVGLCYENMQKYYIAFENYQKAIDNFPHLSNTDEVLAREYAIGNIYLEKPSPKVLGTDIMAPLDRAVEIFKKVVENAPYGKYAEDAQFKLGEALKKSERYEEAIQAYHKLVEDYPRSKYSAQAMYEESYCAYRASLKPAYDATATDNAIKTFEKFVNKNKDTELAQKADLTMKRLKDNVAQKSFETAQFYEAQGKKEAAIIYYQDVIDSYPDSFFAGESRTKIDALKNPKPKRPALPVLDFNKKKETVAKEAPVKKPWKPFSFAARKEEVVKPVVEPAIETPDEVPTAEIETPAIEAPTAETQAPVAATETPVAEAPAASPAAAEMPAPAVEAPAAPSAATETPVVPAPAAETPVPAPVVETPPAAETPAVEPPKEEPVTETKTETPKQSSWKPFNFDNKKEAVAKEKVAKKPWKPFSFAAKKDGAGKPVVETPVAETKKEKSSWKPLNFDIRKDKEVVRGMPVKKPWKPFSFAAKKDEPEKEAVKDMPVKKAWKPFSFASKKEEPATGASPEEPKQGSWKPLNFGKK